MCIILVSKILGGSAPCKKIFGGLQPPQPPSPMYAYVRGIIFIPLSMHIKEGVASIQAAHRPQQWAEAYNHMHTMITNTICLPIHPCKDPLHESAHLYDMYTIYGNGWSQSCIMIAIGSKQSKDCGICSMHGQERSDKLVEQL